MRYVYTVNNYPGATEPVYATLLVHKNQIIGGDITNTASRGTMQPLVKSSAKLPAEQTPSTVPEASSPSAEE